MSDSQKPHINLYLSDLMPRGLAYGITVVTLLYNEKRTALWTTASSNKQTNKHLNKTQPQLKQTNQTLLVEDI